MVGDAAVIVAPNDWWFIEWFAWEYSTPNPPEGAHPYRGVDYGFHAIPLEYAPIDQYTILILLV